MISFVSHLKLAGVAELLDHTSGGALKSISLVESMGQDFLAEAAEETFHEVDMVDHEAFCLQLFSASTRLRPKTWKNRWHR